MNQTNYRLLQELKQNALKNDVPIMMDDGINFLTTFIVKHNIKTILEIGTAVGYSAINMALLDSKIKIISIEKDNKRYLEAVKNIKKFHLEDRITLIYKDALDVEIKDKFDLIFIDAAKGKNISFFEKFKKNLNKDGYIITDNIKFHGYVEMDESEIKNRNLKQLVRKIKKYIEFLKNNEEYSTTFSSVGDGIAITNKK